MTRADIQTLATNNKLGRVSFESRVAVNSQNGRAMTVGYVHDSVGHRELFAKAPSSDPDNFHLCNEFRKLGEVTG